MTPNIIILLYYYYILCLYYINIYYIRIHISVQCNSAISLHHFSTVIQMDYILYMIFSKNSERAAHDENPMAPNCMLQSQLVSSGAGQTLAARLVTGDMELLRTM